MEDEDTSHGATGAPCDGVARLIVSDASTFRPFHHDPQQVKTPEGKVLVDEHVVSVRDFLAAAVEVLSMKGFSNISFHPILQSIRALRKRQLEPTPQVEQVRKLVSPDVSITPTVRPSRRTGGGSATLTHQKYAQAETDDSIAGRTRSRVQEIPASFNCPQIDHDFCLANEEFAELSECIFKNGKTEMFEVLKKIQWRLRLCEKGYFRQAFTDLKPDDLSSMATVSISPAKKRKRGFSSVTFLDRPKKRPRTDPPLQFHPEDALDDPEDIAAMERRIQEGHSSSDDEDVTDFASTSTETSSEDSGWSDGPKGDRVAYIHVGEGGEANLEARLKGTDNLDIQILSEEVLPDIDETDMIHGLDHTGTARDYIDDTHQCTDLCPVGCQGHLRPNEIVIYESFKFKGKLRSRRR